MFKKTQRKYSIIPVALLLLGVLIVAPAAAQERDATLLPPDRLQQPQETTAEEQAASFGAFGLGTQDYWLSAPQFAARTGGVQWSYISFLYFASSVSEQWEAQVELPAGAQVTILECFFQDTSVNDASIGFWRQSYNYVTDTPSVSNITTVSSSGSGGYQKPFQNINETIRYRNGDLRNIYTLIANMPGDTNVRFRGCRFFWNRQISAAPVTATFLDVPTSHPFFQHIEALAASGITAGCGGGNYCPDASVTRGQMAAFLARALGLHWPF